MLITVEPSVSQVPLWHSFIGRICLFKRALVCPGELLQAGSIIYTAYLGARNRFSWQVPGLEPAYLYAQASALPPYGLAHSQAGSGPIGDVDGVGASAQ